MTGVMGGTIAGIVTVGLVVTPALAQHDFRGLDTGRPVRVSDAYPIEFLEVEWQVGATGTLARDRRGVAGMLGLEFGFARNWEVSMDLDAEWGREGGVDETGVDAVGAHVMFNPNQEGMRTPAFAMRAGIVTPGPGRAGRHAAAVTLEGIATRTLGRVRLHVNGGYRWADQRDGGDDWSVGLGADRPIGLTGRLLAADIVVERSVGGATRVWTDVGVRMQASRTLVLDIGLGSRVGDWVEGAPHATLTIGLSRGFGIAALIGTLVYPDPRID